MINHEIVHKLFKKCSVYFRTVPIALKYCDLCREKAYKQGDSLRMHNFRQRQKQKRKAEKTRLQLLEEENELLRARIIKLREEIKT